MKIEGIIPPIPTPFMAEEVAYDKLQENIEKWNQTGISGYIVIGSNGESVYLTREERLKIYEAAKASIGADKKFIAGTGSDSLKETIYLTNEAAARGAEAALVVTPCYFKGQMNHGAFVRYYTQVADAAEIPILLYDVPKFTGVHIEVRTAVELSGHPNIIGIKCSGGNVAELSEIVHGAAAGFSTIVGTASVFYAGLCVGCKGGVLALAVIAPRESVKILDCFKAGDHQESLRLQMLYLEANRAVTGKYGIPGLKAALDKLGYYGGPARCPLGPLNQAELDDLYAILRQAKLIV
ncbi:dihydrodipicolinate synthase family protein [Planctomycetota bacterium]